MTVSTDYFKEREFKNLEQLKTIIEEMSDVVYEYFLSIETSTSPLTRLGYAQDLKIFFNFLITQIGKFSDCEALIDIDCEQLRKIKPIDIDRFMSYLSSYMQNGKQLSNSLKTKNRKLASVRSFFKFLYNRDYIACDPATKIKTPKLPEKPIIRLDNDEVISILNTVEKDKLYTKNQEKFHDITRVRDTAIITLFLGTGIRISELVGINIDDIDFANNAFKITRKGGNQDILYFNNEVSVALLEYVEERTLIETEERALFLSLQKHRIGVRAVQNLVKKYAQIASPLKKITPHKLRSTFGTNLYRETKDIYVVAEVLGHKDINITKKHYAASSDDIKRQASEKVNLKKEL